MQNKIKQGFHRIGVVLAVLILIAGTLDVVGHSEHDGLAPLILVPIAAACAYLCMWALAWIITGFMGSKTTE